MTNRKGFAYTYYALLLVVLLLISTYTLIINKQQVIYNYIARPDITYLTYMLINNGLTYSISSISISNNPGEDILDQCIQTINAPFVDIHSNLYYITKDNNNNILDMTYHIKKNIKQYNTTTYNLLTSSKLIDDSDEQLLKTILIYTLSFNNNFNINVQLTCKGDDNNVELSFTYDIKYNTISLTKDIIVSITLHDSIYSIYDTNLLINITSSTTFNGYYTNNKYTIDKVYNYVTDIYSSKFIIVDNQNKEITYNLKYFITYTDKHSIINIQNININNNGKYYFEIEMDDGLIIELMLIRG